MLPDNIRREEAGIFLHWQDFRNTDHQQDCSWRWACIFMGSEWPDYCYYRIISGEVQFISLHFSLSSFWMQGCLSGAGLDKCCLLSSISISWLEARASSVVSCTVLRYRRKPLSQAFYTLRITLISWASVLCAMSESQFQLSPLHLLPIQAGRSGRFQLSSTPRTVLDGQCPKNGKHQESRTGQKKQTYNSAINVINIEYSSGS